MSRLPSLTQLTISTSFGESPRIMIRCKVKSSLLRSKDRSICLSRIVGDEPQQMILRDMHHSSSSDFLDDGLESWGHFVDAVEME